MMAGQDADSGVLAVLAKRLEEQRLPRALDLEAKVNAGAVLDDMDIEFLERVFAECGELRSLLERHPEHQDLAARMMALYHAITAKALANEEQRKPDGNAG
jgi:hypothetical protein